jgi:hypothetical protein
MALQEQRDHEAGDFSCDQFPTKTALWNNLESRIKRINEDNADSGILIWLTLVV